MTSDDERQIILSRQRRFLVGTSLAVIAFYALDVSVKSDASHSGIFLTLGRPDRVATGLIALWLWSLWRYCQWLHFTWDLVERLVFDQVGQEDNRLAIKLAQRYARKLAKTGKIDSEHADVYIVGDIYVDESTAQILDRREANIVGEFAGDAVFEIAIGGGRLYRRLAGVYKWPKKNSTKLATFQFEMRLSIWQAKWHRFKSWIHAILRLPAINQHIAPLVLSTCAAISPFAF